VRSQGGLAAVIRESWGGLTPSERRVACALLDAYPIAGLETLQYLAARASVSAPTVLRFVSKLGFDGYPEFQAEVREDIQRRLTSGVDQFREALTVARTGGLGDHLSAFHEGLDRSFSMMSAADVEEIAKKLANPRFRVLCAGGRFSHILAQHLHAHLNLLRPGCRQAGVQVASIIDDLVDVDRRTVIAAFDYRRYDIPTIEFCEQAALRKAHIVLFTDQWLSPAAHVAEHIVTSRVDGVSPFDSLVPALAAVETLVVRVAQHVDKRAFDRLADLEHLREPCTWDAAKAAPV